MDWREPHNKEFHGLYSLSNVTTTENVMGSVCGMYGGRRRVYTFWFGNLREADHLEDLGVDGRIILKLILKSFG